MFASAHMMIGSIGLYPLWFAYNFRVKDISIANPLTMDVRHLMEYQLTLTTRTALIYHLFKSIVNFSGTDNSEMTWSNMFIKL